MSMKIMDNAMKESLNKQRHPANRNSIFRKKKGIDNLSLSIVTENVEEETSQPKLMTAVNQVVESINTFRKWSSMTKTRRHNISRKTSSQSFLQDTVLDPELEHQHDEAVQRTLNKTLIMHFVNLDRNNRDDDEVDLQFLDEQLKSGADINCTDKHGQTVLHEAARTWHTDVAKFLLTNKANIDAQDKFGRTPLHVAAATDYAEMVELLVARGANIEALAKDRQTPLHYAARNDATDALKCLIKLKANIEARDYRNRTPLFVAAELDRSETARYLINSNAEASASDDAGYKCMTHMITKMGPVAIEALDQFHRKDRANRRQYFFLGDLECDRLKGEEKKLASLAKSPLEAIVSFHQLDLIMHPVIMRLIDVKWNQFGRRHVLYNVGLNFLYVLVWTIFAVAVPWYLRPIYNFPQDGWRVFFFVVGVLMTSWFVVSEVREFLSSRRNFRKWMAWRKKEILRDLPFCHPKWPEEEKYLRREITMLATHQSSYFQDFWNYLDWVVYSLTLFVTLTHVIDVGRSDREAPCCVGLCANSTWVACEDGGYVNNSSLTAWNNRIFAITIIALWLRLMKYMRAFRLFGPFIVMIGKIGWDVVRWLYLYLEFYIPFAVAFWITFGGLTSISSMLTVDRLLFSLYRITLVDEYEFDAMQEYDIVMAYLLIGIFLGISAILCLNLFIALLSDTFQRVYDNANANAVMQQASLMLSFEENLSSKRSEEFHRFIQDKCSPEDIYYDDDLTTQQDDDLKKVTVQIKEQVDELLEHVREHDRPHPDHDEDEAPPPPKMLSETRTSDLMSTISSIEGEPASRFSKKFSKISNQVNIIQLSQQAQEKSYKKLRSDVKEIKGLLQNLLAATQPRPTSRDPHTLALQSLPAPSGQIVETEDDYERFLTSRGSATALVQPYDVRYSHHSSVVELPGAVQDATPRLRNVTPVMHDVSVTMDDITTVAPPQTAFFTARSGVRTTEVRITDDDADDAV